MLVVVIALVNSKNRGLVTRMNFHLDVERDTVGGLQTHFVQFSQVETLRAVELIQNAAWIHNIRSYKDQYTLDA